MIKPTVAEAIRATRRDRIFVAQRMGGSKVYKLEPLSISEDLLNFISAIPREKIYPTQANLLFNPGEKIKVEPEPHFWGKYTTFLSLGIFMLLASVGLFIGYLIIEKTLLISFSLLVMFIAGIIAIILGLHLRKEDKDGR